MPYAYSLVKTFYDKGSKQERLVTRQESLVQCMGPKDLRDQFFASSVVFSVSRMGSILTTEEQLLNFSSPKKKDDIRRLRYLSAGCTLEPRDPPALIKSLMRSDFQKRRPNEMLEVKVLLGEVFFSFFEGQKRFELPLIHKPERSKSKQMLKTYKKHQTWTTYPHLPRTNEATKRRNVFFCIL